MDLSDLIKNLSAEDIAQLRETAQSVLGNVQPETPETKNEVGQTSQLPVDPKMIEKIMRLSSLMSENDDKTKFLLALKPLLSEKRRQKADAAIQLQRLLRVIRAINAEDPAGHGTPFGQ